MYRHKWNVPEYITDEMSSHFISDFNESEDASNNQLFQHYETPLEMPILSIQNAQYNPMDPIPPTDAIILSNPFQ
ncbi:hypothetical protein CEXT_267711 [Caerostris extrusa]|uniref:Uncharacterized protein n=1 Tax=Caerostris extrusa TaxID=172846 RepID=A0AAV4YDR1_CAEEX|nr:hypothetical protein CEXT_267711 [Caerostris extrusa]